MKRYILTGAPGAGKTTLIRRLETRGHVVVEEAATDVIALAQARGEAEPWTDPAFIDAIIALQRHRRVHAVSGEIQFHDRSPICTYALSVFLGFPVSTALSEDMARLERARPYEKQVFFIDNLGFVTPTEARRIGFKDALIFERVHERVYRQFGYELIRIAPGALEDRIEAIESQIR